VLHPGWLLAVDGEDVAEWVDRVRDTAEGMAKLKPAERRALSLIGLGYTYREIGELTGWSYTKSP
jgi:DNA-directed RNA polymerase specialized sigma24 family protein